MKISKINDEKLTLTISGRLDTTTATQLQEVLLPAFEENSDVILDFSDVEYVSSAGLRVLLMGAKAATAAKGTQILTNVSAEVREVFELTGFDTVLNLE